MQQFHIFEAGLTQDFVNLVLELGGEGYDGAGRGVERYPVMAGGEEEEVGLVTGHTAVAGEVPAGHVDTSEEIKNGWKKFS